MNELKLLELLKDPNIFELDDYGIYHVKGNFHFIYGMDYVDSFSFKNGKLFAEGWTYYYDLSENKSELRMVTQTTLVEV